MTKEEKDILARSVEVLQDWLKGDPERERWLDITYDPTEPRPFVIPLHTSRTELVRGYTIVDALAQAAQVVLLNPELET